MVKIKNPDEMDLEQLFNSFAFIAVGLGAGFLGSLLIYYGIDLWRNDTPDRRGTIISVLTGGGIDNM